MAYLLFRTAKGRLLLMECLEIEIPYLWDMAWEKGSTVQVVGGCEARRLVGAGIEHDTGLHRWPDGTGHRSPPPTLP